MQVASITMDPYLKEHKKSVEQSPLYVQTTTKRELLNERTDKENLTSPKDQFSYEPVDLSSQPANTADMHSLEA